jgi:DNA-binding NarL/FixJ family response regulator
MTVYRPSPAPSFLRRRGAMVRASRRELGVHEALLIAPQSAEASLVEAMLRLLYGYDTHVSVARTLGAGLDQLLAGMPDVVLLSDRLPPQDDAVSVMPILRRCGYQGPIVVIGLTEGRARVRELKQAGAADAIGRYEIEGARFAEAMLAATAAGS